MCNDYVYLERDRRERGRKGKREKYSQQIWASPFAMLILVVYIPPLSLSLSLFPSLYFLSLESRVRLMTFGVSRPMSILRSARKAQYFGSFAIQPLHLSKIIFLKLVSDFLIVYFIHLIVFFLLKNYNFVGIKHLLPNSCMRIHLLGNLLITIFIYFLYFN